MQFDESQLIYLVDDQNAAVLPEDDDSFDSYKLTSVLPSQWSISSYVDPLLLLSHRRRSRGGSGIGPPTFRTRGIIPPLSLMRW